jgi:hypothetical protein
MQFEVDYRLFMRIFLWEGPAPHYQIDGQVAFLDIAEGMARATSAAAPATAAATARPEPDTVQAGWDISVDVKGSAVSSRLAPPRPRDQTA